MKTRYKIGIGLIVFFVSLCILVNVQAYRDWRFVCENTGSSKGHKELLFGIRTGDWYEKSALEGFMLEKHPDELKHRWTSYAGIGKNIFGRPLLNGHGNPGAILVITPFLEDWVQSSKPEDILALYELLASGSAEDTKKQMVEDILSDYFSSDRRLE